MNKYFLFFASFLALPLWAQVIVPPLVLSSEEVETKPKFLKKTSHWVFNFNFEYLKYDVPFAFAGEKKNIRPENRDFFGGRFGFGRELFLRPGIISTTRLDGYFNGTLDLTNLKGGDDEDAEVFSKYKREGYLYGLDINQTLGYLFEMKTKNPMMEDMTYLTIEPYVLAGVGAARAFNSVVYEYDLTVVEKYNVEINDDLANFRLGIGLNFTSNLGYFFNIGVTQNNYKILERKLKGEFQRNGDASPTLQNDTMKDVSIDEIWIYSLGGGFKF
ncbi:MAG TPA: hypothetical protein VNJ01_17435 [Bacteriovoracaceae bacterium]|nr:hypothetical protein [Bacteriovoracaceae bacterium]